jgi:hypothetical protein
MNQTHEFQRLIRPLLQSMSISVPTNDQINAYEILVDGEISVLIHGGHAGHMTMFSPLGMLTDPIHAVSLLASNQMAAEQPPIVAGMDSSTGMAFLWITLPLDGIGDEDPIRTLHRMVHRSQALSRFTNLHPE